MKIVRVTVVSVALVLVSGCTSYWFKPGATRQSFNDDKAHCMAQGYLVAPITHTPVPMGGGHAAPGSETCVKHGNTADCAGYPGTHLPPTAVPVDMNTHARSAVVDACMRGLGYTRVDLGIGGGAATITQAPVVGAGSTSEETLQPIPGE